VISLEIGKEDEDDVDRPEFKRYFGFHRLLKTFSYGSPDLWWATVAAYLAKIGSDHIPLDANTSCSSWNALQLQELDRWDWNKKVYMASEDGGEKVDMGRPAAKGTSLGTIRERLDLAQRPHDTKFRVLVAANGQRATLLQCCKHIGTTHVWSKHRQWSDVGCVLLRLSKSTGGIIGIRTFDIYSPSFQDSTSGQVAEFKAYLENVERGKDVDARKRPGGAINESAAGSVIVVAILLGSAEDKLPMCLPEAFSQTSRGQQNLSLPYLLIHGKAQSMVPKKRFLSACTEKPHESSFQTLQVDFNIDAVRGYEAETDHDQVWEPFTSMFHQKTDKETRLWHNMNELRLPSYYRLCLMEYKAMKTAVLSVSACGSFLLALLFLPMSLLIIAGLGHVMTEVGRRALWIVVFKCLTFLRLCVGYWTDEDVEAFGIHKKVFEFSAVWNNPDVLLRIKKMGLQERFDELRRSEAPTMAYEDIAVLIPALKSLVLYERLRKDYSLVMYGMIAMRATILQAIPYMTVVSVFATTTCANPMFVQSASLRKMMFTTWYANPYEKARRMIEERIATEAAVRSAETHENAHALPNPERDADGMLVPPDRRQSIDKYNQFWKKRMAILSGKHDVVNEWEVSLRGTYLAVNNSNCVNFLVGCMQYTLQSMLIYTKKDDHAQLFIIAFLVMAPYCIVRALPVLCNFGTSLYISDEQLRWALGWVRMPLNLFGCKYTWLSAPEPVVAEPSIDAPAAPSADAKPIQETEMITMNPLQAAAKAASISKAQKTHEGDAALTEHPSEHVDKWQRNPIESWWGGVKESKPMSSDSAEESSPDPYWMEMSDDFIPPTAQAPAAPGAMDGMDYDVEANIHDQIPDA